MTITSHAVSSFETLCMGFPDQFSRLPSIIAFLYAIQLHWEAMELATHLSVHML